MSPLAIAAYLALFAGVAFVFLVVTLLLGRLFRPQAPSPEKLAPYECGEPSVGSGYIQFDLRFYVVALVFIIFEVEVAFFFPWAAVFGKLTRLMRPDLPAAAESATYEQLGVPAGDVLAADERLAAADLSRLALACAIDIALFFAVLLVGFAYAWNRGDLNWVRAVGGDDRADAARLETPSIG